MVTKVRPGISMIDDEVCDLIAHYTATHHLQAEKRHFAETGDSGPIDEERETASEVAALLKMARPNLDGDEQAAINRLRDALRARLARTPASG